MAHFDLLVRNGLVLDGTGAAAQSLDVGVRGGLIASLEPGEDATADRVIDAGGRYVTPGFVDVHTHYDGQATWDQRLQPSSSLGTTTVVMGNCGVGFAPCRPEDRDTLIELMEGVEEIPGTAMAEGLPWTWKTFPEYLDVLDNIARDIDVAALVPHGPVRVFVMGQRGVDREPATEEDISAMQRLIKQGLEAGAVGFSTSRTLVHRSANGDYIPTYAAARDELVQLGSVMQGEQGHVFQMISDWDDADAEFEILRRTSAASGARGTFTLLDLGNQDSDGVPVWQRQLERIERAQSEGLDIRGQVLSRPVGMLMGHCSSMNPFYRRPSCSAFDHLPLAERAQALSNPDVKSKVLSEANVNPHIFVRIFSERFDQMYPVGDTVDYMPPPEDSVAAQAAVAGCDPEEWLYDYLLGNNGENLIFIPATNFSDAIPDLLRHQNTVVALGDGGAHVGSICDASANLFVLTRWVRERGEIELAHAIHMLTRQPAELYALLDRGLIAEGMVADLNVLDLDALALERPRIVHDLPAGGGRLLQHADGLVTTIKSGQVIYEAGQPTDALPGSLLRGARRDPRTAAA